MTDHKAWLAPEHADFGSDLLELCGADRAPDKIRTRSAQSARVALLGSGMISLAETVSTDAAASTIQTGSAIQAGSVAQAAGAAAATGNAASLPAGAASAGVLSSATTTASGLGTGSLISGSAGAGGIGLGGSALVSKALSGLGAATIAKLGLSVGLLVSSGYMGMQTLAGLAKEHVEVLSPGVNGAEESARNFESSQVVRRGVTVVNEPMPDIDGEADTLPGREFTEPTATPVLPMRPKGEPPGELSAPESARAGDLELGDQASKRASLETARGGTARRGAATQGSRNLASADRGTGLGSGNTARTKDALATRTSSDAVAAGRSKPVTRTKQTKRSARVAGTDQAADSNSGSGIAATERKQTTTLNEEVRVLGQARRELRAGRAAKALELLDLYMARYPKGSLAPEARQLRSRAVRQTQSR